MTEEQLFVEEKVCNGKCQDDIDKNYVHCKDCVKIKYYLAGLHDGQPKWHNLRKDPNDLPNDDKIVSDREGNNVRYVKHRNKWFYRHRTCEADVIAWCEIPQFKE